MAQHLRRPTLSDGELSADMLKHNLFAIPTVSDQFLLDQGLKKTAATLHAG